jgi:hypothetical protein
VSRWRTKKRLFLSGFPSFRLDGRQGRRGGPLSPVFAEIPDLADMAYLADFRRGVYADLTGAAPQLLDFADLFAGNNAPTGEGLEFTSAQTVNKCLAGLNDQTTRAVAAASASTITVVEVADLPSGPRAYFEGLTLDGQPVRRVFRATSSVTSNPRFFGDTGNTNSHTASAYVYVVSGSVAISIQNQTPFSANAPVGSGARISTTATPGGTTNRLSLRCSGTCDVYFCAPQLEEAGAMSNYVQNSGARQATTLAALSTFGPGSFFLRFRFPEAKSSGDEIIFIARETTRIVRLTMQWGSGRLVAVASDSATGTNISSGEGNMTSWAPEQSITAAVSLSATGRIGLSVDGGTPQYSDTHTVALGVPANLFLGASFNATIENAVPGTHADVIIEQFAWGGPVI